MAWAASSDATVPNLILAYKDNKLFI